MLAGFMVLAFAASPSSSRAADQPFKIVFDTDQVKIGLINELPIGATTAGGSIEGTVDEAGNVSIPKENFKFPLYGLTDPIKVEAYMAINGPATGTWDAETGQLVLNAKAGIWVRLNIGEVLDGLGGLGINLGSLGPLAALLNGDLACGFSPMDVSFTTEAEGGARFTKGTLGTGAIVAQWSQLGKFAGQSGVGLSSLGCPLIKSYAPTLLEGLLGGALPGGIDLGGLNLASLLDNLDNLDLGESSLTLTRTLDESPVLPTPKAKLSTSMVTGKKSLRSGKAMKLTVRVRNSGDGPASGVKVCMKLAAPLSVSGGKCQTLGMIMAGSTRSKSFYLKARKKVNRKRQMARVSVQVKAANTVGNRATMLVQIRR